MSDEILDLNEFLERVQNDKKLLLELLDIFVEDFQQKRKLIDEAVAKSDYEQIKRISHSLKGSSGNISAKSLREILLKFEEMGKNSNLSGVDEVLVEIDAQFQKLIDRIHGLKEELNS